MVLTEQTYNNQDKYKKHKDKLKKLQNAKTKPNKTKQTLVSSPLTTFG